jgi:CheY-like chemotaxis protein
MRPSPVVLIVEDEPLVRIGILENLAEAGFEVIEARNADEAIAILEQRPDIHVVFTDIEMPGSMDGLRLAHFVRHRWPPIKIIATSGYARVAENNLPSSVAIVMNDGLLAIAVAILFLDNRLGLRLMLLDDRAIAVTMFADGYAGIDRSRTNANLIGKCGSREGANDAGCKQILLHGPSS